MDNSKSIAGFLVILNPAELAGKVPFYLGNNIIGRSEEKSTIIVRHPNVSQKHAILKVTNKSIILIDIGSKNGTKINGEDNFLDKDQ